MQSRVLNLAINQPAGLDDPLRTSTDRRITLYVWLIAAVVIGSTVLTSLMPASDVGTAANNTDMTAFYGAGMIVRDGHAADLYDPAVQLKYEQPYFGTNADVLPFSYPPHVAVAYVPLTTIPFRAALVVSAVLLILAIVAALRLIRPMVPVVARYFALSLSFVLMFLPLQESVGMGQNAAVTLLLLAWIWRSLDEGNERSAGMAIALMMYKPQFAVPLMGLLIVGRHFKAVGVALLGTALIGVFSTVLFGLSWPARWIATFSGFTAANELTDTARFVVSPVGFSRAVLGVDSAVAQATGIVVIIAVASVLIGLWSRQGVPIDLLMAATAPGIILTSPHSMAFSPTLLLLTVAVVAGRGRLSLLAVLPIFLSGWIFMQSTLSGFNIAAPTTLVVFLMSAEIARRSVANHPVTHPSSDALTVEDDAAPECA